MRTIHKFTHEVADEFAFTVPASAKLLHVDRDTRHPDDLAFWFEVGPDLAGEGKRGFVVVGTGMEVPAHAVRHINSVKIGYFIWHVYEARV